MFSKISRYRGSPDIAVEGVEGRVVASKGLRLLPPELPEGLVHTVEDGDRLDHLAFKYYKQPRAWWHIADANPEFLSPEALLGSEPRSTLEIPVAWEGPTPPWSGVLRELALRPGIERAVAGTPTRPRPHREHRQGLELFAVADAGVVEPLQALAQHLRTGGVAGEGLSPGDLVALLQSVLEGEGVVLAGPLVLLSVETHRWRVSEEGAERIHAFHLFEDEAVVRVYENVVRHEWILVVVHDPLVITAAALLERISDRGFSTRAPTEIRREGKPLVIPPRRT